MLYRVPQQSLPNAFKAAPATQMKIRLRRMAWTVFMEIFDNGCMFSLSNLPNGGDRQPLGSSGPAGTGSVPKRGATVRVQIPLRTPKPVDPFKASEPATFASN